tara:strand:+ start:884 stop:1120 length:237 start_codon:yes stop_codon:yes gene_type:complete
MLLSNFEMKLFKKNGLWGVKDEQNEFVPPNYKDPKDAIYEWKWFEIDNLNNEPHRKYLPLNRTLDEINQIETDLLNCI